MKRLRPRFTVRRLMVTVAIAGLLSGAIMGLRRRPRGSSRSLGLMREAHATAETAWGCQRFGINADGSMPEEDARQADRYWRLYAYHKDLREKYVRASSEPWLPVAPDPPEPE